MKKNFLHTVLQLSAFFLIANLPFLTVSQLIGVDSFIDSFTHPDSFLTIKNEKIQGINPEGGYLIVEQPSSQEFSIAEGDCILYQTTKDTLQQNTVSSIKSDEGRITYYTTSSSEMNSGPIYKHQIIGKIIGRSGANIWMSLSLQIWEASTEKLNILALFSNS